MMKALNVGSSFSANWKPWGPSFWGAMFPDSNIWKEHTGRKNNMINMWKHMPSSCSNWQFCYTVGTWIVDFGDFPCLLHLKFHCSDLEKDGLHKAPMEARLQRSAESLVQKSLMHKEKKTGLNVGSTPLIWRIRLETHIQKLASIKLATILALLHDQHAVRDL